MKIFAALLTLALACALAAETPAQNEEGPPAWAYPVNPPAFKPTPDDGKLRRVPGSSATYTLRNCAIASSHRTGIRVIILPCPKSSREAESPMFLLAAFVTGQTGRAVQKTRGSPVFLRLISYSRWPILRAVLGRLQCRNAGHFNC